MTWTQKPSVTVAVRPQAQPTLKDVLQRLARVESRLVQLMLHQGMETDGQQPLNKRK